MSHSRLQHRLGGTLWVLRGARLGCALLVLNGCREATPSIRPRLDHPGSANSLVIPAGVLDFQRSAVTIVILVNTSCQYCIDSMRPYRELLVRNGEPDSSWQAVFIGTEPESTIRAFLIEHQLASFPALSVRPEQLRVDVTPALALLDRDGRLAGLWQGEPSVSTLSVIATEIRRLRARA